MNPTDFDADDLPSPWADNIGTSTSDEEAPLREIGRQLFGIRYPGDEPQPRTRPRLTNGVDLNQ